MRLPPFLVVAGLLLAGTGAHAQTLYLQENLPYSSSGATPGMMLEVVREMARALHIDVPVRFMPWPDAQKAVREGHDGIIFPFTRTPAREPSYGWLLKFWDVDDKFFVREGNPMIDGFEAAAAQPSIGVIGGSAQDAQLKEHNLPNIHRYDNTIALAKAVAIGEVTAGYAPLIEAKYAWIQQKLPGNPAFGRTIHVGALWLAMSKDSPGLKPEDWQQAFDALQQDGTFDRIYATYFGSK
jgi:ABC-type amino acid transport substrate-binding protein